MPRRDAVAGGSVRGGSVTAASVPRATYRLQLTPAFGFDDAAAIAPYLARLGVSHVYCSPYLQAAPGSTHGYDIVDHGRVNAELGGEEGRLRMVAALHQAGLGQVIDIVPNHMAVTLGQNEAQGNRWWWDVLMHGPASRYARYFDVDWSPPETKLRDRVLLPILGEHYGVVLRAGQIVLQRTGATFTFAYFDHVVPVSPRSLDAVLVAAAERCDDPVLHDELRFIGEELGALPLASDLSGHEPERRRRATIILHRMLERAASDARVAAALDEVVATFNADTDRLHELLERQNYRLARWQIGPAELDYRRFFDITDLAGIRVEDPEVFDEVHRLPLRWVTDGSVTGLRVDHPDGLRDPAGYLRRLAAHAPGTWIVVEKILEPGESLRADWPVAGTTGYDVLNQLNGLFIDATAAPLLDDAWRAYTGDERTYEEIAEACKRMVLSEMLAADLARLVNLAVQLCEAEIDHRDHSRAELRAVTEELVVAFPVYRTYVRPGEPLSLADGAVIERVVDTVAARRPDIDPGLLDLMAAVLTCRSGSALGDRFAERFQQLTGPVMAKAVEDTAFYRYLRLAAVNEVGGDPGQLGMSVAELHAANAAAAAQHPHRMVTTSTHDTKRSEDVRLRIAAISELPQRWRAATERWDARCAALVLNADRDRPMEYLLHQTLVGAHPLSRDRAHEYLTKAMRESKEATSWLRPDEAHEARLHALLDGLLDDAAHMAEVAELAEALRTAARPASLSQRVLALTVPGVPDLYQGSELWTDGLVDPDNRRPVDYADRAQLLERLQDPAPSRWADDPDDRGTVKLWVTTQALHVRRARREAFIGPGASYVPLPASGPAAEHAVAFVRGGQVITVATRLAALLAARGGWGDSVLELPPGTWRDVFTERVVGGGALPLARALDLLPVALLVADASPGSPPEEQP